MLVRREELTSFARVKQETARLTYFERNAYLQGVVGKRAPAMDREDVGAVEFLYRNPTVEVCGPRG
jgi:hypothetical protein